MIDSVIIEQFQQMEILGLAWIHKNSSAFVEIPLL